MQNETSERGMSFGRLFGDLSREVISLVRQEVDFAKTEMSVNVKRTGRNVTMMAMGGAVLFMGILFLLSAAVIGLSYVIPVWLSALLVGGVVTVVGVVMLLYGARKIKEADIMPRQTLSNVKEDQEWMKNRLS